MTRVIELYRSRTNTYIIDIIAKELQRLQNEKDTSIQYGEIYKSCDDDTKMQLNMITTNNDQAGTILKRQEQIGAKFADTNTFPPPIIKENGKAVKIDPPQWNFPTARDCQSLYQFLNEDYLEYMESKGVETHVNLVKGIFYALPKNARHRFGKKILATLPEKISNAQRIQYFKNTSSYFDPTSAMTAYDFKTLLYDKKWNKQRSKEPLRDFLDRLREIQIKASPNDYDSQTEIQSLAIIFVSGIRDDSVRSLIRDKEYSHLFMNLETCDPYKLLTIVEEHQFDVNRFKNWNRRSTNYDASCSETVR